MYRFNRRSGQLYKVPEAKRYANNARYLALSQGAVVIQGNVRVTIHIYRKRKTGDLDNKLKLVLDALEGVVYENDKQVVELHAYLLDDKDNPRVEVAVNQIPPSPPENT